MVIKKSIYWEKQVDSGSKDCRNDKGGVILEIFYRESRGVEV